MIQKKTTPSLTQRIHTLASYLSDGKIIATVIVTVFLAIIGTTISALNLYYNLKSAPLIARVDAVEQRDVSIETSLVSIKRDIQTVADFINDPKVKVLRVNSNISDR